MAVREYVGARYVPKIMGTWNATTEYEALSIVDDGMGTSYISRKPVPPGTALNNTDYWFLNGSTTGAITSLQNRVTALENDIVPIINIQFVTPQAYGAVGDGVADDTQAFKDAINTGLSVYIPDGQYLINDHLQLQSNTYFFGPGTIIDNVTNAVNDTTGLLNINSKEHIIIEGIKIIGQGSTSGAYTYGREINAYDSKYITVRDVYIEEVLKAYAICFETCDNVTVSNSTIKKYTQAGVGCINVCNNVLVEGCHLIDVTGKTSGNTYPIMLNGYDYAISTPQIVGNSLKAIGNTIDNPTAGAYWEGIDAHGGDNIIIADNVINNCYVGIGLAGSANFTSKDVMICNNTIRAGSLGSPRSNINTGITCSYVTRGIINGNVVEGFDKWTTAGSPVAGGMFVSRGDEIEICNNIITNCGQGSGHYTIYVSSTQHLDIHGNNMHDNNVSADVRWTGETEYVKVHHNTLYDGYPVDGATTSSVDPHDIRVWGNDVLYRTENGSGFTPQFANNTTIVNITTGKRSETIEQRDPISGAPMGYICKSAASAGTPAVWIPLPNIP